MNIWTRVHFARGSPISGKGKVTALRAVPSRLLRMHSGLRASGSLWNCLTSATTTRVAFSRRSADVPARCRCIFRWAQTSANDPGCRLTFPLPKIRAIRSPSSISSGERIDQSHESTVFSDCEGNNRPWWIGFLNAPRFCVLRERERTLLDMIFGKFN